MGGIHGGLRFEGTLFGRTFVILESPRVGCGKHSHPQERQEVDSFVPS